MDRARFIPEEFTPTAEEYFWSTVYPRPYRLYTDKSGESTFYFNINMTLAAIEAYRKMGNTYTAYKWFKIAELTPTVARSIPRAAPMAVGYLATPVIATAMAQDVVQSGGSNLAVVSGTPGAQPSKPWWMPLAVWHALYS